jgi:hypothetical protein
MKPKVAISLAISLAALLFVITACNQSNPPTTDTTNAPGPLLCNRGDLNDPVISACRKTFSTFPRREIQLVKSSVSGFLTSTMEYESSDRWQIEWQNGNSEKNIEIYVGPSIYTKNEDGNWQTTSLADRRAWIHEILSDSGVLTETVVSVFSHVSGSEMVGTTPTTIYESVFDMRVGGQVTTTTWIGADGLIYKQNYSEPTQASTTVYEYDPDIKIDPPTLKQG